MNATRAARRVNPATAPNPRDGWPDWTDADRWTIAPDPAPEPTPTDPDAYTPTPLEAAEALGFALAFDDGRDAYPSGDWPFEVRAAFIAGREAGRDARGRADAEFDAWVDSEAADRMDEAFGHRLTDADVHPHGVC